MNFGGVNLGRKETMDEARRPKELGEIPTLADLQAPQVLPVREFDESKFNLDEPEDLAAHTDFRNTGRKLAAGWRGLKLAVRGDSSFFAHGYRGTLIAIAGAFLGINQWGWCLLIIAACLVLISELASSAVDTLARAIGDSDQPLLKNAREIATAGVTVAAVGAGAITAIVLSWKFIELMGWRQ
jgi:diacylglycerol kinase (ATP)